MIEMFDKDKKGTITVHEFGSLFAYINQWKATFESIDKDRSGFIEQAELNQGTTLLFLFFQICTTKIRQAQLKFMNSHNCLGVSINGRQCLKPMTRIGQGELSRLSWTKVSTVRIRFKKDFNLQIHLKQDIFVVCSFLNQVLSVHTVVYYQNHYFGLGPTPKLANTVTETTF